jgi:hypothetical protein
MKKSRQAVLVFLFLCVGMSGGAKDYALPTSPYRKYFWGAREAYQKRDFTLAQKSLHRYRSMGAPVDKLIQQSGCDIRAEVAQFTAALTATEACLPHRQDHKYWTEKQLVVAELSILKVLQSAETSALEGYVDCAPSDLTAQANVCQDPTYPAAADLSRLASALKEFPDVLDKPNWREFPVKPGDPLRVRWTLYTYSDHWKPCGMEAAPLLSLRQDADGKIRIAGFASSCLESRP